MNAIISPDYYYVLTVAGQSNAMAYGEGLPLPDGEDAPHPRIKQLARFAHTHPGGPPCHFNDIIPLTHCPHDVQDMQGGAQIAVGTFWPTVKLHDLRLAARIAGDITTSRLMHMATEAALHVADQLKDWRKQREAEGAESLASVLLTSAGEPVELINGESAKVYRFRRAVYSFTRASVLEGYRDVGTTPKGDKDAEALDRQIDDLWRDGRWSIADIREEARIYAELF